MLNFEKETVARARRIANAETDFDRRACAGQLYPDTAHTMSELLLFATLHGMTRSTIDGLIIIIESQERRITELQAEVDRVQAAAL